MSNYNPSTGKYETKDSGKQAQYADGMKRDTSEGKPQFALLFPKGVPFEDQLITRVADLYHRGALKYGDRNWENSSTEESLAHHEEALMRHVIKFLLGVEDGEDHGAAVVWNVNAVDLTRRKIAMAAAEKSWPDNETEQLPPPFNPNLDLVGYANKAVSRPDRPAYLEGVSFRQGDTLLDKNYTTWKYCAKKKCWEQLRSNGLFLGNLAALAKEYGPLMVQTGPLAWAATILKDGSLRWG